MSLLRLISIVSVTLTLLSLAECGNLYPREIAQLINKKIADSVDLNNLSHCTAGRCLYLTDGKLSGIFSFFLEQVDRRLRFNHPTLALDMRFSNLKITYQSFGDHKKEEQWVSNDHELWILVYLNEPSNCVTKGVFDFGVTLQDNNSQVDKCKACRGFPATFWRLVRTPLMDKLVDEYVKGVKKVLAKTFTDFKIC